MIFGVGLTTAQDTSYTLRGLAEQDNLHIGAAVYTRYLNDPVLAETLAREFNMLTPEQEGKACEIEQGPGQYDFRHLDQLVAFAEAHDMAVHGHTLMWHQCTPSWIENGDFTREEAIGYLRDYIHTVVGRYKGRIAIWDVANEGMADDGSGLRQTPWQQLIGDDYMELAFQFAHEADPDALLFYNDYGAEGMGGKADQVYDMVSDWVARGIPINGVGLQSHFTMGTINAGAIAQNIQRLGELGLQVQFTEVDVRYDGEANADILQQQARDYHKLIQTCVDSEYCTAFIVWGVSDRTTWLRGSNLGFYENPTVEPLLFDDDYKPKPAYFAVLDVLARKAGVTSLMTDDQVAAMMGGGETTPTVNNIPEPSKSDPAQLAPDTVPGLVYYAAFPVSITLDGNTDDWANVPRGVVDSGPTMPTDTTTTMTFAAAADDTNLYFLAEVQDEHVSYGTHGTSEWYQEDSVEFYLNTTGDLTTTAYEPGIVQIGIMAANLDHPDEPLIGGGNSADSQVSVIVVPTDVGYTVEASVPLKTNVWDITPEQGGVLGFQVHLNGSSNPDGNRNTKLIWSIYDTQDQSYNDPSLFGQLIFWDATQ